ncbi:MAG TPA: hypothetical protein VGK99_10200 [Acidobacteriota bacterium]|jgi:hypothetical protein
MQLRKFFEHMYELAAKFWMRYQTDISRTQTKACVDASKIG